MDGRNLELESIMRRVEYIKIRNWSIQTSLIYGAVVGLWILYLMTLLTTPVTDNTYNLSAGALLLARLSVAIPYLIIWLAAAFAYIKLKRYALSIATSPEAPAFTWIADGIVILLVSLLASTFIGSARSYLAPHLDWRPFLTIAANYAYVVPYLVAFIYIYVGSKDLIAQMDISRSPWGLYAVYGIPFIIFLFLWLESIFTNTTRFSSSSTSVSPTYYLRDSVLVLTIIIPSIVTWVLGLLSVINLRGFRAHVQGLIYKKSLTSLVYGLALVILGSILLQAVLSLGSQRISYLGLGNVLAIVYTFLLVQTAGFFLISRGARKLSQIESV